ncbi:MAG: ribonuclease Y [Actinobacteria bacterium]|nr:ribonuclease Y [Actinomycetota bacterium]MCG2817929.1 ribonuclease Y [Actinomycetes bacterium]MBU4219107.1 ribonuclease Y [Actinomycetota bacterium]MBU4358394.1 ribonuclease Y [Actinomycetota bacterium]MBU4391048.1 ribonuclease Y [Actinomycetota bacterium]
MIYAIIVTVGLAAGFVTGFFIRRYIGNSRVANAETTATRLVSDAKRESENLKREAQLEAKDSIHTMRGDAEREIMSRRSELQKLERRLNKREENVEGEEADTRNRMKKIVSREEHLKSQESKLARAASEQKRLVEKVAMMSTQEAKEYLLETVRSDVRSESALFIKEEEGRVREEADKRARKIISLAIQRCASEHVAETTVSVVMLPNDEMKGRIIGREGRNIRTFENLTGINLIIDDTPEAVILSSFDPVRREIARISLEKLISDGRIQPARIEEMYEKAKAEVENEIREAGEEAVFEVGIHNLNKELVRALGRLKFRTSYGQNVLMHSLEVSRLAGIMASELGLEPRVSKRAGLLHDIGKAIDHEVEGSHALIGAELAKRLGESEIICQAIEAHHGEVDVKTIEDVLIQAGDAISAARPGARRETLDNYIKRLEKLEALADSFDGVDRSYAMQAGREIRVVVQADSVDDVMSASLARDIAREIEDQLDYPGQIKITVIRETRVVEYAK